MRSIILGTDWWDDCDDAVALRVICQAVKRGDVRLLGICINACMQYSVSSLKGFLTAEGMADIPVGIDLCATDFDGSPSYQKRLSNNFAPNLTNNNAEEAVRLYRRLLSSADDKVEIIEIGFLHVVADLLKSGADDISDKNGIELFKEKVAKVWVMAGKWDADGERENNFCRNMRASIGANAFCELCPVPVTFLGFEIGYGVITGQNLEKCDHLHEALLDHGSPNGRHSWDPMLVSMAIIGDEDQAGYNTVTGTAFVDPDTGADCFVESCDGLHRFVVKKYANAFYEDQINAVL